MSEPTKYLNMTSHDRKKALYGGACGALIVLGLATMLTGNVVIGGGTLVAGVGLLVGVLRRK